ncbi:TonB system transport protein ExbD [Kosakonia radicincitans]|nr:TonB system transport protein ExbD [Kosakonia radicincitans]QEM91832.1 TonB system transport protein ExbD [Kosakonia radicincitans]VVT49770.1 Biopolymer transport protein ExbD/TolR [Kosakonia radicincitans]
MAFSSQSAGGGDLNALAEINVTPVIDVMLVLLIIFMVAAPLSTANIPLDLPSTTSSQPTPAPEPITVSLKSDNQLYIGDKPVSREDFIADLDAGTHGDKDARIFLRADKDIDYARLMTFMDLLRDGGYTKVALIGLPSEAAGNHP